LLALSAPECKPVTPLDDVRSPCDASGGHLPYCRATAVTRVQNEDMTRTERDDVAEGIDLEPYGKPAYTGRGQAGDEVADAMTADLTEAFGSDDPAAAFKPHREGPRELIVGRLVEDDDALESEHDDVTAHDSGEDDDLTAEEAALHYVDPENDPIPE